MLINRGAPQKDVRTLPRLVSLAYGFVGKIKQEIPLLEPLFQNLGEISKMPTCVCFTILKKRLTDLKGRVRGRNRAIPSLAHSPTGLGGWRLAGPKPGAACGAHNVAAEVQERGHLLLLSRCLGAPETGTSARVVGWSLGWWLYLRPWR